MSKPFLIMKTGNTVKSLLQQGEDFEDWIIRVADLAPERFVTVAVDQGEPLPPAGQICALIITGSPAFITDNAAWNDMAAAYVTDIHEAGIPILGICYGHQLLAQTFGGAVGFHPGGREIGTVLINSTEAAVDDALFAHLGQSFSAQVSHLQTVTRLPEQAVLLAGNNFEPHHGFRLGTSTWGIQFHPEFSAMVMQAYIAERQDDIAKEGLNPDQLSAQVKPCDTATNLLRRFALLVESGDLYQEALSSACASS